MAIQNSIDLTATGVITHDGAGVFSGSALTQFQTLVGGASNAISGVAVGTSGQVLTSGGAGVNPTFTTKVSSGLTSTDNALSRWSGTGGDTLQDSTVIVTDNGEMSNASQPCFLAQLASDQNTATGDATEATVIFGTEIFDQNADFNNTTGVFTAPVTGRYQFNCTINITGLTTSHTAGTFKFVASNRTLFWNGVSYAAVKNSANTARFSGGVILDMDASDTCSITVTVSNGTKVVNIASNTNTFSGALIC
jgi:hypothetical protein